MTGDWAHVFRSFRDVYPTWRPVHYRQEDALDPFRMLTFTELSTVSSFIRNVRRTPLPYAAHASFIAPSRRHEFTPGARTQHPVRQAKRNRFSQPVMGTSDFARPCPRNEHSERAWEHWRELGSPRYVVAPMVDGSELAFRDICRRYGANMAYTPMLHSRTFSTEPKYRREHFTTHEQDRPVVAQFCANDPATLVNAARHVQDHVDAIDLNLGCPQGIAKRGHYGSFLQDEWDLIYDIVRTAATELTVPIWVKIRIFDDIERTLDYACMLQHAGASVIAVHGRTREQKGKEAPPAKWSVIKQVVETVTVPVIANGNVRTKQDADDALRETGAAAVMSAWALLNNPATFIGEPAPSRLQLAYEYLKLAEKHKTPHRMVRLHLFKMLRSRLDVNMDLNEPVARCRSFDDFRTVVQLLEHRCDFDGISFEQRELTGDIPENVVCDKKIERMKRAAALERHGDEARRAEVKEAEKEEAISMGLLEQMAINSCR